MGMKVVERIFLLLLVLAEDANIFDVGIQEAPKNCVSKTTCASGDEKDFVLKY